MHKKLPGTIILWAMSMIFLLAGCSDLMQSDENSKSLVSYTCTYNGNGNTGGKVPGSKKALAGEAITLAVNVGDLVKTGYSFAGWNTESDGLGTSYQGGATVILESNMTLYAQWVPKTETTLSFYAATTSNEWYLVDAQKLAENDFCVVYGETGRNISASAARAIADEYKNNVYPKITDAFGGIMYMPNNKNKIILLLLDIQDGFSGSGGYVAGYFDSTHMLSKKTYPYSNEAAMLFMDVYPGDPSAVKDFCTVIAHELQHLIHFSKNPDRHLWINEGLSLAAEYIYGGEQITQRIDYFNGKFVDTTIPLGNNFFVWDGYWEQRYGDYLADYATAYLFFRWLGIQAGQNNPIYQAIINSEYADYRAVTGPASQIDLAFSDWKTLLGTWMLANYYQKDSGLYGYQKQVPALTISTVPNYENAKPQFYPGEGVFSLITSSVNPSQPDDIYYIGLPQDPPSSSPPSLSASGPYTGKALLTFNGNSNEKGLNANGYYVASSLMGSISRNAAARDGPLGSPPGNYPVDFREMAKKNRP
ncbi:MAG: InlB B-repeat-containing protein [Spirochaetaceae bacterium]|nr:InlB B-repeat-containing protein [Spirochaetaceae bacterium]